MKQIYFTRTEYLQNRYEHWLTETEIDKMRKFHHIKNEDLPYEKCIEIIKTQDKTTTIEAFDYNSCEMEEESVYTLLCLWASYKALYNGIIEEKITKVDQKLLCVEEETE